MVTPILKTMYLIIKLFKNFYLNYRFLFNNIRGTTNSKHNYRKTFMSVFKPAVLSISLVNHSNFRTRIIKRL